MIKLKTNLKSLRTKHTFAVKNLQTEQGIFLESIAGVEEGDQLTGFQNGQLKRVATALSKVEISFDKVSADLVELVSLLSELQNREGLTAAHVKELQEDEKAQGEKYEARSSENNGAIKEAVKILAKWRYEASSAPNPSTPASTPVQAATAQPPQPQRRRFVAVDGF